MVLLSNKAYSFFNTFNDILIPYQSADLYLSAIILLVLKLCVGKFQIILFYNRYTKLLFFTR